MVRPWWASKRLSKSAWDKFYRQVYLRLARSFSDAISIVPISSHVQKYGRPESSWWRCFCINCVLEQKYYLCDEMDRHP